jgi:hypothetical protein
MLTTLGSDGGTLIASIEVAPCRPHDRVQKALQVVGAVEGDPHDPTLTTEHLHLHIGLQPLSELVLSAP